MIDSSRVEGLLAHVELKKAERVARKEQLLSSLQDDPDASRENMMATIGITADLLRTYVMELFNARARRS